jgi:DHA1 family bicyclomycin/chloramphenicol resistance-like MFS transporter
VLGALSGFAPLSIDMYLPGLPALQHHFDSSPSSVQLTLTACLLGLAVAQVVIGPLSDRIGRRVPLLAGVALYSVASLLCAIAPSLWLFTLLRFVQGAAGAAGIVISRAMVRDMRSGAQAVRLFSMLQIVNGFFPAAAPVIGAQLLRVGSWRFIFVVLSCLGVVILFATVLVLPESLDRPARSTGGLVVTLRSFGTLLKDGAFVGYALVSGFVTGAMFAYISGSSFVLEDIFGLSPQVFSAVFAMNAAGIVVMSQLSSSLVARVGPARLLWLGVVCSMVGGIGMLVSLRCHFGLSGVLPSLFLTVSAVGIVIPSSTALAMAEYPHIAGSASGLLGVVQFLIGASCAPIVGAFGTRTAFPMALVILVLACFALVSRAAVARFAKGDGR